MLGKLYILSTSNLTLASTSTQVHRKYAIQPTYIIYSIQKLRQGTEIAIVDLPLVITPDCLDF